MPRRCARSFADAEARKDHAEQVVGGEFAGDRRERRLRLAQLLGEELERRRAPREVRRRRRRGARRHRAARPGAARARGTRPPCPPARRPCARISSRSASTPAPVFADRQTWRRRRRIPPSASASRRAPRDRARRRQRSILLCTTIRGSAAGSCARIAVGRRTRRRRPRCAHRPSPARGRRAAPRPRCARCRASRSDRRSGAGPAVSMIVSGMPPISIALAIASRVVPANRRDDRDVVAGTGD